MIFDTIDQAGRYAPLHAGLAKAFEFLQSLYQGPLPAPGRYEIDGDRVFAGVDSYTTKPLEDALFEAHRKYADVQFLLSGRERILWAPLSMMEVIVREFDTVKDVAKWQPPGEFAELPMEPGRFAVLFPEDAHAPGVVWGETCEVLKVVVKVALD
ncbi:DUF386 domain-containing protein [Phragmitibacter flavus]|uniref:DUF386 domain-containing protein n=1 Tax=Phragmitibacter flavus TaxID=2576071 RepID=A0A5R8KKA2_9BACT|nr:YhcH/YjgK/YiaL family protein [Phragmitibacter flavus]TLD72748.1 DUF386 domain-containing protein [Phragmitibacter flavus]